jgi:hypothetical protein
LTDYITTSIGSPFFRVGGIATPITNSIFLFSNAIEKGITTSINVASGKRGKYTAASFWWKTVLADFLPKIIMAAIAAGFMGVEMKKMMDGVSEYDKSNYTIIPLGFDKTGKTIYLRIPHDETGRLMGGLMWKIIGKNGDQSLAQDVFDVFSFGAGQFPNVSPAFTGMEAVITYLAGKNPYDSYRGRNVIPDTEFKAGIKYSLPILLQWLVKNQGLGIIFPSYKPDDPTELEKILTAPVLSNILGRWIKVSDYGVIEQLQKVSGNIDQEKAEQLLRERNTIDEAIKAYQKESSTVKRIAIQNKVVSDIGGDKTKRTNTLKKFKIGVLRGQGDIMMNSLIDASTNAEKIELLTNIEKEMSKEQFDELVKTARKEKVISDEVYQEFKKRK